MFGIPISASAAISGYRLTVERITRIANNLNCFVDLPIMDQSRLLKENADLLVSLRGAIFFDSRKKGVNQVLISMGIGELRGSSWSVKVFLTWQQWVRSWRVLSQLTICWSPWHLFFLYYHCLTISCETPKYKHSHSPGNHPDCFATKLSLSSWDRSWSLIF